MGVGLWAAGLLAAGCQGGDGGGEGGRGGGGRDPGQAGSLSPAAPPGYGDVFLDVRECASYGAAPREVPCRSERAAARVTARHHGGSEDGRACPAATDFVLHLSESRPSGDENGDGLVPRGYACMRNLQAPHPGDPGGGGGPHTVVGDCVYEAGGGRVRETACDGSGDRSPGFRVERAVGTRAQCPPATRLYVQLGGGRPVGCARPV
ncbi:hypothetical protein ACQPZG_22980 [Streptomyces sp. CA-294286]|uniref:hypothetical protein n=1 Tax=Streptomyces sp. CA-294286 TaxID=3240070 RepID=UPI003D8BFE50